MAIELSETNDAFAARLQAIFADEARSHLASVSAGLAALAAAAESGDGAPASTQALIRGLQERLHTLKGAAHAVGLDELELLCHGLETAIAALAASPRFDPARLVPLAAAVELAGELLASPPARVRNQALAQAGELGAPCACTSPAS